MLRDGDWGGGVAYKRTLTYTTGGGHKGGQWSGPSWAKGHKGGKRRKGGANYPMLTIEESDYVLAAAEKG